MISHLCQGHDSRPSIAAVLLPLALIALMVGPARATRRAPKTLKPGQHSRPVIAIVSGDQILVGTPSEPYAVRLDGIDAPDGGQPHFDAARRRLAAMAMSKTAHLEVFGTGGSSTVARVVVGGRSANDALLQAGLAWACPVSKPGCGGGAARVLTADRARRYAALEEGARRAKRGVWASAQPVKPRGLSRKATRRKPSGPRTFKVTTPKHDERADKLVSQAGKASNAGDPRRCIQLALRAHKIEPTYTRALLFMGKCACEAKDVQRAQWVHDRLPGNLPRLVTTMCKNKGTDIQASVHGDIKTRLFHARHCERYNCKSCIVVFGSAKKALKAGYRPHQGCTGSGEQGRWSKSRTCRRNSDCVLMRPLCPECPPCRPKWRKVWNVAHAQERRKIRVTSCRKLSCQTCARADNWLGKRAVCDLGLCVAR